MKKTFSILALAVGCLAFAACSSDDFTEQKSALTVSEASTAIGAGGGTASFRVDGPIASVYAADSWLTVSQEGNLISLTAPQNQSAESRNTIVVVKASATDSTIVNIQQFGAIFIFDNPKSIATGYDGGRTACSLKYNIPVTASASDSWITVEVLDDSLGITLAPNTEGHLRNGYVYVDNGMTRDSVRVVQCEPETDLPGTYYLMGYNMQSEDYALISLKGRMTLSANGRTLTYKTVSPTLTFTMGYTPEAGAFTLPNAITLGKSGSSNVFNLTFDEEGYLSWDKALSLTGFLSYDEGYAAAGFDGIYADLVGSYYDALVLSRFSTLSPSASSYKDNLYAFLYPTLVKVPEEEEPAAAAQRAAQAFRAIHPEAK